MKELARAIKTAYNELKKNTTYKLYNVLWNTEYGISEITVENDAEFKAIIIGNTSGSHSDIKSRGYMYLFYTNDRNVPFPTIKEIERRLKIVANKQVLSEEDCSYYDWEEYGSLEEQRAYFEEILLRAVPKTFEIRKADMLNYKEYYIRSSATNNRWRVCSDNYFSGSDVLIMNDVKEIMEFDYNGQHFRVVKKGNGNDYFTKEEPFKDFGICEVVYIRFTNEDLVNIPILNVNC